MPDPQRQRLRRAERAALIAERGAADGLVGCPFRSRCPSAHEPCHTTRPEMRRATHGGLVACHLYHPDASDGGTER